MRHLSTAAFKGGDGAIIFQCVRVDFWCRCPLLVSVPGGYSHMSGACGTRQRNGDWWGNRTPIKECVLCNAENYGDCEITVRRFLIHVQWGSWKRSFRCRIFRRVDYCGFRHLCSQRHRVLRCCGCLVMVPVIPERVPVSSWMHQMPVDSLRSMYTFRRIFFTLCQ